MPLWSQWTGMYEYGYKLCEQITHIQVVCLSNSIYNSLSMYLCLLKVSKPVAGKCIFEPKKREYQKLSFFLYSKPVIALGSRKIYHKGWLVHAGSNSPVIITEVDRDFQRINSWSF